jgi:hypothetical protein
MWERVALLYEDIVMIVREEKRLNVSRREVIYCWCWNTVEARQHHANMPRQLVKVLEATSCTKTKAAWKHQRSAEDATAEIDPKAEWTLSMTTKKERLIIVWRACRIAVTNTSHISHTQQCRWTHPHIHSRICAWTEDDGTSCDDATDKCRHRPPPMVPATSRWATPRSFAQSLVPLNRDAQEVPEMLKQRLRLRLAWPGSAASSARDVQRVTSELALHMASYSTGS